MSKKLSLIIVATVLLLGLLAPLNVSLAANDDLGAKVEQLKKQGLFPNETDSLTDFRTYISNFYIFSIGASILIATVLIMIGGMIWVTSAGNPTRISKAKDYITNSIIGVILLLAAYTILQLINPAFVSLKSPTLPKLGTFGACISTLQICDVAEETQCKKDGGDFRGEGKICCNATGKDKKGNTICGPNSVCDFLEAEFGNICSKTASVPRSQSTTSGLTGQGQPDTNAFTEGDETNLIEFFQSGGSTDGDTPSVSPEEEAALLEHIQSLQDNP